MNNLEIIISGNLTGFSRFYASSGANNLFKDTKIDLDCRNFVTFVEEKDKAYAISFAPQVITLSLITRILDSFHRPGILVVSLLLPRNTKVESVNNSQDEKAVYQLLNAINNKFYERNFKDGMLIQNPIVLMQDYYTDILVNYRLTQDYQRGVNLTIDNSAFNKNIGYVKSSEKDIASYLNTPCRRAYEGYHSIIISPKAPQNIDEPVKELKLYNVYVENTNQRLSNVTIDSVIQAVFPKRGEIDNNFPKEVRNLTYRQVLDGQGGKYIGANIAGDTINLVYHFEKETKQVTFQIIGENGEIDFSHVNLVVRNDDGTFYTIANNPYIFEGEEIYGRKTLESGDDKYKISQLLDLSRITNDGIVPVKVSLANGGPSSNRTENALPLVPTIGGNMKVPVVNERKSVETDKSIKKSGIFSNSIVNNSKDEEKTNHEIRKILIPLVALWLVLGGIYAAWTYFDKNSEPTNIKITASDIVNETIGFYIADTSGEQGEVSDSLKKNGYDKLGKNNIILDMSTSINGTPVINTLKSGMLKNDTILYAINVNGNVTDTLTVNLKVKWNGGQETILEEQRSFLLSNLNNEKYTIQLPVAFSDLIFYDEVKHLDSKKNKILTRISAIGKKSEKLYDALMAVYNKKPDEEKVVQPKTSEEIKLEDDAKALEIIRKGNKVNLSKYKWGNGHRQLVEQWNAAIINKNKERVKQAASGADWETLQKVINQVNKISQ